MNLKPLRRAAGFVHAGTVCLWPVPLLSAASNFPRSISTSVNCLMSSLSVWRRILERL